GGSNENKNPDEERERDEKIFQRELNRLALSLEKLDDSADLRIAMVHFPPVGSDLKATRTTKLLEDACIQHCVFGHLHNVSPSQGPSFFGCRKGIAYHLTSCDYLDFIPAVVAEI
ncbi:MAG: phosphoesterase, partial [Planctomycetota bacterium]